MSGRRLRWMPDMLRRPGAKVQARAAVAGTLDVRGHKLFHDSCQPPIGAESIAVTTKHLARNSRVSDRKHLNTVFIARKRCFHPCSDVASKCGGLFWPLAPRLGSPQHARQLPEACRKRAQAIVATSSRSEADVVHKGRSPQSVLQQIIMEETVLPGSCGSSPNIDDLVRRK